MAEPLKNLYSKVYVDTMLDSLGQVYPSIDKKAFRQTLFNKDWERSELKQRMRRLAVVLNQYLFNDYKQDIELIVTWVHQLKGHSKSAQSFEYLFLAEYVDLFGQNDVDLSLKAIEEITQFTSCEFAIRSFIINNPKKVMAYMLKWSKHKNANVRRFASEGCRPRLPWGTAIQTFKKDPTMVFPILENLKNDPELYVRKSVANNLNDIAKDNPNLVIEFIQKWKGTSEHTDWILKHGSRTLLKKANAEVLALFDLNTTLTCKVVEFRLAKPKIKLGDTLQFSFTLNPILKKSTKLRIEFAVYYVKATGKSSRKLFKITENTFEKGQQVSYTKGLSFKDLTIRKHYAGKHKIALVVNGNELAELDFMLL
jgi:3-methyladenine DNA glycosylase AlkC